MDSNYNTHVHISSHSDEVMASSEKCLPYVSKKNVESLLNLNGKVKIDGEVILCSHLSSLFALNSIDCYRSGKKMKIAELFSDENSIKVAVPNNFKEIHENLMKKSCDRQIIACDRFGNFLHKITSTTVSGEQRFFLLNSASHAMSFKIMHKTKEVGGVLLDRWVVHFFDPNRTNVVSRSEVLDRDEFLDSGKFSLRMFISRSSYKDYFEVSGLAPVENECAVYEYSDVRDASSNFSTLETLSQDGISGCMIYHMMSNNISSLDIRGILESRSFSTLSSSIRRETFFSKSSSNFTALYSAMEQNKPNSIILYDNFLEELSYNEQLVLLPEIIKAESAEGAPALFMAMQENNTESINSFGLLINRLMNIRYRMSTEDFSGIVLDVLSAKRRDGLSALSMALFRNNYDSILAFGGLLDIIFVLKEINSIILSNIIFMLLNCKDGMGTHSMFYAFREGYTDTVFAFGALIDRLLFMKGHIPDNDMASMIFRLLNCENNDGAHGILYAFKEGYADTVRAFGTLIDKLLIMKGGIPDTDMADMIFKLLMPKFDTGSSGLLFSLQRMNIDTVVAFGELVSRFVLLRHGIPEVMFNSMMLEILTAKRSDGVPGIFLPLARNNINIVGAYNSLLAYAPKEVRKQIFCAKDSNGLPALYTLMFHNNPQSLTAYACFLQSLSCDEQIDLLPDILVSKNDSGTPALFIAMQEGYDTCVDAYASLIENKLMKIRDRISPYDFADIVLNIVLAKRSDGVSALLVGIYNNRVSAIEAYSRLLDKILLLLNGTVSYDKLADVVYIVISYCLPSCDTSSIFISMCRGQADSIIALGLLIDKLMLMKGRISHDRLARMIFKLLKARTIKNVDGLFMALQEGNTDAIVAFSSLVDKFLGMKGCVEDVVLVEMLFSLLICKSGDKGIPGLFMAMQNGHHSAVDAFRELLEKTMIFKENVSREYFNNMLLDIVTSRRSYGVSGLSVALKNNFSKVIKSYGLLLNLIPKYELVSILVASDNCDIPAALSAGEEALDIYLMIVSNLPTSVIYALYSRLSSIRMSIVHTPLSNSDLDGRYKALLKKVKKLAISSVPNIVIT